MLLGIVLVLAVSGCTRPLEDDEATIDFVRNSEFSGSALRLFVTLEDGREVSVNTADDAVDSRPAMTPVPGHQARDWTFVKDVEGGTSVAYALVSWDRDDPADYLVAGWWAEFPDQHLPYLSFRDSIQYSIVDGPEIDPSTPPRLPLQGQARYVGQAGGLYRYVPGTDWGEDEGAYVVDEYEGVLTMTADFAGNTVSGCIGCEGDLVTRRAHFDIFLGDEVRDVRSVVAGYELHLGEAPFNPDGTFDHVGVTVTHPERIVTHSEGQWGGSLSNIPDQEDNPRLVAGFSGADFEESDGSVGRFTGTFVALSDSFRGIDAQAGTRDTPIAAGGRGLRQGEDQSGIGLR